MAENKITADDILTALIALSDGKIWAKELTFFEGLNSFGGKRRADFWTLEPIVSKDFRATAYEIKVTRSDFFNDTDEKQSLALKWSDRFWYVTPPKMLASAEIPEWAGHQEFDGLRFTVKKRAPKREKANPDWQFIANLIRSSGQCQRDTEILKSQLSFFKWENDKLQKMAKIKDQRALDKFNKRMLTF